MSTAMNESVQANGPRLLPEGEPIIGMTAAAHGLPLGMTFDMGNWSWVELRDAAALAKMAS